MQIMIGTKEGLRFGYSADLFSTPELRQHFSLIRISLLHFGLLDNFENRMSGSGICFGNDGGGGGVDEKVVSMRRLELQHYILSV
jgi:hypothetical protein